MNQPVRVLIVDNQERTRKALEAILTSIGRSEPGEPKPTVQVVAHAASAREALETIALRRPDVVLMEARLPGMDGLEATRLIKQAWPAIRVIILTMYPIDKIDALQAGAEAVLFKDGDSTKLEAAILNRPM